MKYLTLLAQFPTDAIDIPRVEAGNSTIENVLKYVFVLIGAVSVLMIVIAGVRYIISSGNPQNTAQARSAIIYAIVGLVISISAFAIVNFIFSTVK